MPEEPNSFDTDYESDSVSFNLDQDSEPRRPSFTKILAYLMLFVGVLAGIGLYLFSYLQTPPSDFVS